MTAGKHPPAGQGLKCLVGEQSSTFFLVSRDNNSSSTYSLFLPTGTFLVVHRSAYLIFPFAFFFRQRLLLLFLLVWNERVDTIILCIHNVILSNPILTCCRIFWARSEKCSNNHKCRRFVCICKKAELYGIVMCCAAMFLIKMFVSFFKWFKNVAKSYSGFCCYSIGTCQFPCI